MAAAVLTPELALRYLGELSTDIRAAVLVDPDGAVAASDPNDPELGEVLRAELEALLAAADRCHAAGEPHASIAEVEATMPAGSVFAVRRGGWAVAVVAGRYALSSLMRYDMRAVLDDLAVGGS